MEGGASVVEDIRMFTTGCLTPRMTPRILHYLSQSPSTPTWAPDPAKGLAQHYISLQGLNSCIASFHMLGFALVHCPAALLDSWRAGKIVGCLGPSFSTLSLHLRLHLHSCRVFQPWAYLLGCWVARVLCTGCYWRLGKLFWRLPMVIAFLGSSSSSKPWTM